MIVGDGVLKPRICFNRQLWKTRLISKVSAKIDFSPFLQGHRRAHAEAATDPCFPEQIIECLFCVHITGRALPIICLHSGKEHIIVCIAHGVCRDAKGARGVPKAIHICFGDSVNHPGVIWNIQGRAHSRYLRFWVDIGGRPINPILDCPAHGCFGKVGYRSAVRVSSQLVAHGKALAPIAGCKAM